MEPKFDIIKYSRDDVEAIREEFNLDTKEKREEAFRVIEEWLLKQDHLIKKTYSRDYLERCIVTCKGSIEQTKLQIDRICTMRTLLPKYFQISNMKDSEIMIMARKCYIGYPPRLTKERIRVTLIRLKPNDDMSSTDFDRLNKFFTFGSDDEDEGQFRELLNGFAVATLYLKNSYCVGKVGEFLKNYDYCKGFVFVADCLDINIAEIFTKINLVELQQFLSIITEGYGCKIKSIIFLTSSRFIEGFIKMIKPLFKEKIRNRIHVATTKERLKDFFSDDLKILPVEYGGTEKPLEELHEDLCDTLSSEPVSKLLKEMNAARTDETRRQRDKFNDQYMGMAGTFRTISLD